MEREGEKPLDNLERDGCFQLFVSTDGMRAEIVVKKPFSAEDLVAYEELEAYLKRKGIVFGLTEEVRTRGKLLLTSSGRYLVAEGVRPQRGKDGEVRYFFEEEVHKH
ncbi:MAG: flagellar assembly protein A, partial [Atribacterota bacterium]